MNEVKLHWKHWLLHSGHFLVMLLIVVALDCSVISQIHHEDTLSGKTKIGQQVIWLGETNLAVWQSLNFTNLNTSSLTVQVGFLQDGTMVWRPLARTK